MTVIWPVTAAVFLLAFTGAPSYSQINACGGDTDAKETLDEGQFSHKAWRLAVANLEGAAVVFRVASETFLPNSPPPPFAIVSPYRATTPAALRVSLNPDVVPYLPPGTYGADVIFRSESGAGLGGCGRITLSVRSVAPPVVLAVGNAASMNPTIAPGSLVTIFGERFGPPLTAKPDAKGVLPTSLGLTTVFYNGVPMPMIYVSQTQINAIVPYDAPPNPAAGLPTVTVQRFLFKSPAFPALVNDSAPGIFAGSSSGSGPGAILNVTASGETTVNSASNPARRGSIVTIFGTGSGLWNVPQADGQVAIAPQGLQPSVGFGPPVGTISFPPIVPRLPVSLTIAGRPAQLLYAGAAPFLAGTLQINAVIPNDAPSGAQPISLTVGTASNTPQQNVTVFVE
jgi:uncharacterized protein (TIGR03437 family)